MKIKYLKRYLSVLPTGLISLNAVSYTHLTEATAEFVDKLITISTCDNGLNNRRFVIVAKELT